MFLHFARVAYLRLFLLGMFVVCLFSTLAEHCLDHPWDEMRGLRTAAVMRRIGLAVPFSAMGMFVCSIAILHFEVGVKQRLYRHWGFDSFLRNP